MKLWLFTREMDYETYYGFLVRAETQERAWEVVQQSKTVYGYKYDLEGDPWTCQEITSDGPEILIHASYSSG